MKKSLKDASLALLGLVTAYTVLIFTPRKSTKSKKNRDFLPNMFRNVNERLGKNQKIAQSEFIFPTYFHFHFLSILS